MQDAHSDSSLKFVRTVSAMARSNKQPGLYISIPKELSRYVQHGQLYEVVLNLLGTVEIPR